MPKKGQIRCRCGKFHPMPKWAKRQNLRMSGLIEDVCEHGVGHPNADWLKEHDPKGKMMMGVHGCDGCCSVEIKRMLQGQRNPKSEYLDDDQYIVIKKTDFEALIKDLKLGLKRLENYSEVMNIHLSKKGRKK